MADVDEEIYPEYYRKSLSVNSRPPTPETLGVASILSILSSSGELRVRLFSRPEDSLSPYNELLYTEEEAVISLDRVEGRCYVRAMESSRCEEDILKWSEAGPDRWFYRVEAVLEAGGDLNCPQYQTVHAKLRTLDIFAGAGGFSEGLRQSGLAETLWAIERDEKAILSFKENHPDCTVLNNDSRDILLRAMKGVRETLAGEKIPGPGEVELLCGGPPCQGFSNMNRFNSTEYYQLKNNLVANYLSFCEFYRPRFFILENIKDFTKYRRGLVLRLSIRALTKMGYQVTHSVLEAGQHGVPQSRKRLIILAAAPGERLPHLPQPRHVFPGGVSAPFRAVTVRDSISDLPSIRSGRNKTKRPYDSEPQSFYQRMIRRGSTVLRNHLTKEMSPLNEARIQLVPTMPGSDWRDLPNTVVELRDGARTRKLEYNYKDISGAWRGVCPCAGGGGCLPDCQQENTIIPWYLPHRASSKSQFSGLYGRVGWEEIFSTVTTKPDPSRLQGRVIHPQQDRVLSVREMARAQGFPDTYRFHGSTTEKYRQIGNAVPPALGKAIGLKIREILRPQQDWDRRTEDTESTTRRVSLS